jgi:TfoX/Sxy family transcriptional regulator of competence genes
MAYDDVLAERVRDRLLGLDGITEKKMFGGLAFLSYGNMTVGVHGDELIARIDPATTDSALKLPGVRVFDMTGRPMKGWVLVAGESLDDDALDRWIGECRKFVATLPPK